MIGRKHRKFPSNPSAKYFRSELKKTRRSGELIHNSTNIAEQRPDFPRVFCLSKPILIRSAVLDYEWSKLTSVKNFHKQKYVYRFLGTSSIFLYFQNQLILGVCGLRVEDLFCCTVTSHTLKISNAVNITRTLFVMFCCSLCRQSRVFLMLQFLRLDFSCNFVIMRTSLTNLFSSSHSKQVVFYL